MKKLLGILVIFILVLAGCGSTNADGIVIGMWESSDNEMEAVEQVVDEYTQKTGTPVEIRLYTDYSTELNTELQAGTAPDAFYVEAAMAGQYIQDGALAPMSSYMTDEEIAAYYPEILASYQDESGEIYGLPKDTSTVGIFCNEDVMKSANSSCSEVPDKFEEWPEFMSQVQKNMPQGHYVFVGNNKLDRLYPYFDAGTNGIMSTDTTTDFSNPEIIKRGEYYFNEFSDNDGFKFAEELGYEYPQDAFLTQEAAIVLECSWLKGYVDDEMPDVDYTVIQSPTINGKEIMPSYPVSWSVNSQSKHMDQAIEFAKFASTRGAEILCEAIGAVPANTTVAENIGAYDNPTYQPFLADEVIKGSEPYKLGFITQAVLQEWNNQIPLVINGEKDVKTAFEEIDQTIASKGEQFNEEG